MIGAVWVMTVPSLSAQELRPRQIYLHETYKELVATSGDPLVAAHYVSKNSSRAGSVFALVVDPAHGTRLCIDRVSRDGRYEGQLRYDIVGVKPGPYTLSYRSDYEAILKRYESADVAVVARLQPTCEGRTPDGVLVPVSVPGASLVTGLRLVIQSLRNEVTIQMVAPTIGPVLSCHQLSDSDAVRSVAFDTDCTISPAPPPGLIEYKVKIRDLSGTLLAEKRVVVMATR